MANGKLDTLTLLLIVILVVGVVWAFGSGMCQMKCSAMGSTSGYQAEPTTACGWLKKDLNGLIGQGWTAKQISEAGDACQQYTDTCGEASARTEVMGIYQLDPFTGAYILPILQSDLQKAQGGQCASSD
jgi:hypothetical protein